MAASTWELPLGWQANSLATPMLAMGDSLRGLAGPELHLVCVI